MFSCCMRFYFYKKLQKLYSLNYLKSWCSEVEKGDDYEEDSISYGFKLFKSRKSYFKILPVPSQEYGSCFSHAPLVECVQCCQLVWNPHLEFASVFSILCQYE